ncbi:MAG: HipA domain-containing protein [Bdellovibrionales bacterium]|nr:HipA domain-containing protein [Massilia sp.]
MTNEYFVMRLAGRVGLQVPQVYRHYCPEPVYLIARFDRELAGGATLRRHMIDTCQLFNKARTFKYRATTLDTLQQVLPHVRTRSLARQILYRWLMFNVMVGNGDNHLKNISFMVPGEGIEIAPCYDLLSTAVYSTRALADSRATWPAVEIALPVPDAPTFGAVTRAAMLEAGRRLGLKEDVASRELENMRRKIVIEAARLYQAIETENAELSGQAGAGVEGDMRVLRTIVHLIIAELAGRLG